MTRNAVDKAPRNGAQAPVTHPIRPASARKVSVLRGIYTLIAARNRANGRLIRRVHPRSLFLAYFGR